ncbi:MAG TPA: DUF1552 domain-containing protein [Bryobacteraceae bacterium]|nr:DUF1552 domain-containing protein [Bryobacteraceae bacterium]
MIITGKHLPRRTFLRGVGAAIALPMLDAMRPAFAAGTAAGPVRLAFTYIPNGATMKEWTPTAFGKDYALTRILKPLEPFRNDFNILTGLAHKNANALGDGGGDHARAGACFLTGVHPKKTDGADISVGISTDQIVAQALSGKTRFASLELGCEDTRTVGNCDTGYSCAYTNSISWRSESTPLPPETNPRMVFERLFGAEDLSLDPETRARRQASRRSILDMARGQTERIMGKLGPADQRKIDEYLTAVREIEKRIESAENQQKQVNPGMEKPAGVPMEFSEYLKLMFDLQVVAFQTDMTRVATLMVGREGSVRTYPEIGVPDPHHPTSHHRNLAEQIEKITKINVFHAGLFAYFLGKLKATKDGDGTLLDNSMIVYGSAIADGNRHTHEDLPILVAGRGGGKLQPGRHIQYATETPVTNLYLSLLDHMGVQPEKIGDSTGKLSYLAEL